MILLTKFGPFIQRLGVLNLSIFLWILGKISIDGKKLDAKFEDEVEQRNFWSFYNFLFPFSCYFVDHWSFFYGCFYFGFWIFKCKCLGWMKMHLNCSCYLLPIVDFKGIGNFNVLQVENENWKHCVVPFTFEKTRILVYFKSFFNVLVEGKCIWIILVIFVHDWFQKNM